MNFKNKEYFGQKCLVTFLSLLMVSNINLTCIPKISASNTLPDKSVSIKSEKKDSWWKRIVSRPENIIKGTFILGFSTLAALIFGKSIDRKKECAETEVEHKRSSDVGEHVGKEREESEVERQKQAELARIARIERERKEAEAEHQRQAEQERLAEEARKEAEAERQKQAELARIARIERERMEAEVKRRNEEEVARLISDEANKAVVVWQPGAIELAGKEAEEAARIERERQEEAEIMPASGNEQHKKKSLAVHPVVTGAFSAFSYATNAVYYGVVKPTSNLISLISGDAAADIDKKFNAGELGKRWMGRIKDNIHFHEMLIPGSHDSGTYTMRSSLAETQTLNIYDQLSCGVRCLDFRIRSWWDYPCVYHGPAAGEYMSNILSDVNKFVTENPLEVIFIKMETGSSSKCSENGLTLTLESPEMQAIKDRCLTKQDLLNLGKHNLSELTMGDMRSLRRNIVIISDHKSEFFHSSKNLISKFDSESRSAGTVVMVGKTLEMLNEPERRGRLNSISPIHTANAMKVVCGEGSPLAQEFYYSAVRNQMLRESSVFIEKANMVSLDDIERNAEFIYWLISINHNRRLMIN